MCISQEGQQQQKIHLCYKSVNEAFSASGCLSVTSLLGSSSRLRADIQLATSYIKSRGKDLIPKAVLFLSLPISLRVMKIDDKGHINEHVT